MNKVLGKCLCEKVQYEIGPINDERPKFEQWFESEAVVRQTGNSCFIKR